MKKAAVVLAKTEGVIPSVQCGTDEAHSSSTEICYHSMWKFMPLLRGAFTFSTCSIFLQLLGVVCASAMQCSHILLMCSTFATTAAMLLPDCLHGISPIHI